MLIFFYFRVSHVFPMNIFCLLSMENVPTSLKCVGPFINVLNTLIKHRKDNFSFLDEY